MFTAQELLPGQTSLPDNPRDDFLNYLVLVLSAPSAPQGCHAPSPAPHPVWDGDGGAAP